MYTFTPTQFNSLKCAESRGMMIGSVVRKLLSTPVDENIKLNEIKIHFPDEKLKNLYKGYLWSNLDKFNGSDDVKMEITSTLNKTDFIRFKSDNTSILFILMLKLPIDKNLTIDNIGFSLSTGKFVKYYLDCDFNPEVLSVSEEIKIRGELIDRNLCLPLGSYMDEKRKQRLIDEGFTIHYGQIKKVVEQSHPLIALLIEMETAKAAYHKLRDQYQKMFNETIRKMN